jgi:hypothetical protein
MLLVGLLGIGRVRAARGAWWITGAAFGAFGRTGPRWPSPTST